MLIVAYLMTSCRLVQQQHSFHEQFGHNGEELLFLQS